jgi:hypothetical protein
MTQSSRNPFRATELENGRARRVMVVKLDNTKYFCAGSINLVYHYSQILSIHFYELILKSDLFTPLEEKSKFLVFSGST